MGCKMLFRVLIWGLARLMIWGNKRNSEFRRLASSKNAVFQLMTMDKSVVRQIVFENGVITTLPLIHPKPEFTISFKDSRYGFSVLISKKRDGFLRGVESGDIHIKGDFSLMLWFQNLTSCLRSVRKSVPERIKNIGFIGTGFIGAPMVRSLLRNGFKVKTYDKNPEALDRTAADGALPCCSLSELSDSSVIIIMVNTMDQVKDVVTNLCRVLPGESKMPVVVMSTVSPDGILELKERLINMGRGWINLLDAPVSGAPFLAEAGKLSIMVGGEEQTFNELLPVFEAMGEKEKIFYIGPLGKGAAMKLVNNTVAISTCMNFMEALRLGQKNGLNSDRMAWVINASSGKNFLTEQWVFTKMMFEMILNDTIYSAKDALFTTGVKDLKTASQWAKKSDINLTSAENAIRQIGNLNEEEFEMILRGFLEPSNALYSR